MTIEEVKAYLKAGFKITYCCHDTLHSYMFLKDGRVLSQWTGEEPRDIGSLDYMLDGKNIDYYKDWIVIGVKDINKLNPNQAELLIEAGFIVQCVGYSTSIDLVYKRENKYILTFKDNGSVQQSFLPDVFDGAYYKLYTPSENEMETFDFAQALKYLEEGKTVETDLIPFPISLQDRDFVNYNGDTIGLSYQALRDAKWTLVKKQKTIPNDFINQALQVEFTPEKKAILNRSLLKEHGFKIQLK